jgi:hypothetical protein
VIACTLEGQAVTSDAGFTIAVKRDADALATAQTLIIPPTNVRTSPTSREARHHRHQRAALVIYHAEPDSPSVHQDHKL